MKCFLCKTEAGDDVICDFHKKNYRKLPRIVKNKVMAYLHTESLKNFIQGDYGACFHCKKIFSRNMLCGDHILTKGARPDLKFNLKNIVPSCAFCNGNSNLRFK